MSFRGDRRGQSIQLGLVILLGAVILFFTGYQAVIVPEHNRQVEFKGNAEARDQLVTVRNAVLSAPDAAGGQSVTVGLGVRYPERLLAVNPGPGTGTLRTVGTTDPLVNVTVDNATADGDPGDVWNGSARNFTTGALQYDPDYNEFREGPTTVYENTVLFNELEEGNRTITGQQVVEGDRITLLTMNGSLARTGAGSVTVDARPLAAATRTVAVTNDSSGNVTLTLATRLDEASWQDLLDGEFVDQGGHVVDISTETRSGTGFDSLVIELEGDRTYQLRVARVGIGDNASSAGPAYVAAIKGDGESVPQGGTRRLEVEVRNGLDNSLSGITLNASTGLGKSSVTPAEATTDEDGRVTLTYEAPGNVDGPPVGDEVNVSFDTASPGDSGFDPDAPSNRTLSLSVQNTNASGMSPEPGAIDVTWLDPSDQSGVSCPSGIGGVCEVNATKTPTPQLTVATDPGAGGVDVSFATNTSSAFLFNETVVETDGQGRRTVDLMIRSEGGGLAFGSAAGDGDTATLEVTDLPACSPALVGDFEAGTLPSGWFSDPDFADSFTDATAGNGQHSAYVNEKTDYVTTPEMNTSDCATVDVAFWLRKGADSFSDSPESGEDVTLQYRNDASSWVDVNTWAAADYSDGETIDVEETITAGDAMHDGFRLRWTDTQSDGGHSDFWHVDDVVVNGDP